MAKVDYQTTIFIIVRRFPSCIIILLWKFEKVWLKVKCYVANNTVWRVIFVGANFCGKSENFKALKINFHGFKFHDSNQSRGVALHKRCN